MFMQILEILFLVIVFILVLGLTYFATRALGMANRKMHFNKNMEIIEILSLAPGQQLCIVKVGESYYLIGVTQKSQLAYLTKLDPEQLDLSENKEISFQEQLLQKMKGKREDG